jgi:glutamate--cysteine ligase
LSEGDRLVYPLRTSIAKRVCTLTSKLENRLKELDAARAQSLILNGTRNGIEKENLRVSANAHMAKTKHPEGLGSSLTHPFITTDYAENLLEIVTPPVQGAAHLLSWLENLHTFAYQQLNDELLWAPSMPCPIKGPDDIIIAQYGTSPIGRMRTLYREGLGHRYEKKMQTIAGIHFNYSLPETFWQLLHENNNSTQSLQTTINQNYFALLRNFLRYGWLIDYLFGTSPAFDQSFLSGTPGIELHTYKQNTLYAPYACSLRMSDLGYHNATQKELNISFNSLEAYATGLSHAIQTPYPPYQAIFDKYGKDAQINANLLQIEAEYYAPVRAKRVVDKSERQSQALLLSGVEYIEVRAIDINPYEPLGISPLQIDFTEIFLLYCLLTPSPDLSTQSHKITTANTQKVVSQGRKPDCELIHPLNQKPILLNQWAQSIFEELYLIADFLDTETLNKRYRHALDHFAPSLADTSILPSAKMLEDLFKNYDSFTELGLSLSKRNKEYFAQKQLSNLQQAEFNQMAQESLQKQALIEAQALQ